MKKLLALVLCVMLFVSVVPSAAYAELSGSAVDLSAAYQKLEELNQAYAKLAVITVYKNGFDGFNALANAFAKDSVASARAKESMRRIADEVKFIDLIIGWSKLRVPARTYEKLFEGFGGWLYKMYDYVGDGVKLDAENAVAKVEAKINEDVAKEITKVEDSIDKATSDALSGIKVPEVA